VFVIRNDSARVLSPKDRMIKITIEIRGLTKEAEDFLTRVQKNILAWELKEVISNALRKERLPKPVRIHIKIERIRG